MRERLSGRLMRIMRRQWHDGEGGPQGRDGDREADGEGQGRTLDWTAAQARLAPVRHRWDLAILCNLDETQGRRPADLLAAVNSQAGVGRALSPQVLSGRLRELEHSGYVRHEDLTLTPLNRVYYLLPPGQALISHLSLILRLGGSSGLQQPSSTGRYRVNRTAPPAVNCDPRRSLPGHGPHREFKTVFRTDRGLACLPCREIQSDSGAPASSSSEAALRYRLRAASLLSASDPASHARSPRALSVAMNGRASGRVAAPAGSLS